MNRTIRWMTLLAAMAATSTVSSGQIELKPGMMGVADVGSTSCAVFSDMHYHGPVGARQQVLTWFQGYVYAEAGQSLDAVLAARSKTGWDFDALTGYVVGYCEKDPSATVADGVVALWAEL